VMMIISTLIAFVGGILFTKKEGRWNKFVYASTILLITANLFVFKYFNFAVANIEKIAGQSFGLKEIVLPIGISFYTFQILSYVIDLYNGNVALQTNFFNLLLYVSFFPQLIAGPIVRYSTVEEEIGERKESIKDATEGVRRFCFGLAKKVLIANGCMKISEIVYSGDAAVYGSFMYWIAAIAFSLHIYFDFSGYSDMAIGLGRIFGFHFLENFDHPYTALSVTEFWRKWHISLSSWFRDYIYIPLGGNRVGTIKWIRNIFVVWALTGLWHGASWNFVLWGLYYAVLLILDKFVFSKFSDKLPKVLRWAVTALLVILGWVIFNFTDFDQLSNALLMMFNFTACNFSNMVAADSEILTSLIFIPLGIVCMLPIGKEMREYILFHTNRKVYDLILNVWSFVLFALSIVFIMSTKFNPFIYFRF